MNSIHQDKLRVLASDELMLQAINVIITETIEKEKPSIRQTDTDEMIGQKYRAYEDAIRIINNAFIDIRSYNSETMKSNNLNRGK